ncbi:MAG: hypothetical protein JXA95_06775 [Spirochaetales bacterium]|nr:hypothetical protein [Spirochaetales bacterium]
MRRMFLPVLMGTLLLILTCTTNEAPAPVAVVNQDAWKSSYRGETVYVITQGTVGVDVVTLLMDRIPQANWVARFDFDPDVSGNYLVLDYQSERSGTPIAPVIRKMFSSMPVSGTLQVSSNRIRMGYFEAPLYEGWNGELEAALKAYAGLIKGSMIQKTQGPWYADPLSAYVKTTRDRNTGEDFLTAVNYYTGEEKTLLSYRLITGARQGSSVSWNLTISDLSGKIEWVSGLVSGDIRAGSAMTGFYGAVKNGRLEYSGTSSHTPSFRGMRLMQADLEFANDLMLTWVAGRSLRRAWPDNGGIARIESSGPGEWLVSGQDLSGNPILLFRLFLDSRRGPIIETYRKIRTLELPLIFNGREQRSYTFTDLRADFTQEIDPPVASPRTVAIAPMGKDRGFADLTEGLFFSLTVPDPLPEEWTAEQNRVILMSNYLPYGNLEFIKELIAFYPPLDILSVDTDLIPDEKGESEYALILTTSPMEPGVTYQVSIQPHPSLFEKGYVWEFTGAGD